MPLTYACASFRPVRHHQVSISRDPQVISSQPTPQLGMIIGPPSELWVEKDSLQDTQRLRGGGVGCTCCGGGGGGANSQQRSPLEPQPGVAEDKPRQTEQPTPKLTSKQKAPKLSQPTPPSQTLQAGPSETPSATKPTGGTLTVQSRSSRTHSSPSAPPTNPSVSQPSRTRHQTLPSKLSTNNLTQVSSSSNSHPIPEDAINYGKGVMRSPAFPPSVHIAGGSRKAAGGPPSITAPFMKD